MKRPGIYKKNAWELIKSALLPLLFTLAVVVITVYGISNTGESTKQEGARILEDSIRRAIVTSYALEGRYPASIEHIERNFGVFIDRDRYIVHYMIFGSNVMPGVVVINK